MEFSLRHHIILLIGILLAFATYSVNGGWGFSNKKKPNIHNYDIGSKKGLNNLYNKKVVHAERVERPLSGMNFKKYPISHTGTKITLDDGSKWLVHKGNDYGKSGGNTVVTNAKHMSNKWDTMPGTAHKVRNSNVGDFVKAGGTKYSTLNKNCHKASKKMGKLP